MPPLTITYAFSPGHIRPWTAKTEKHSAQGLTPAAAQRALFRKLDSPPVDVEEIILLPPHCEKALERYHIAQAAHRETRAALLEAELHFVEQLQRIRLSRSQMARVLATDERSMQALLMQAAAHSIRRTAESET